MADLRITHVLPRWHHGGPAQSILVEAEHAKANGTGLRHSAIVLEKGGSIELVRDALKCGLRLHVAPAADDETSILAGAEIVVLHFWNTPSVRRFIDRRRGTHLRWALDCAVNGLWQPQRLPIDLAEHACHVILTSPHLRSVIRNDHVSVVPAPARLKDIAPGGMEIAAGEYGYDLPYFRRMAAAGAVLPSTVQLTGVDGTRPSCTVRLRRWDESSARPTPTPGNRRWRCSSSGSSTGCPSRWRWIPAIAAAGYGG